MLNDVHGYGKEKGLRDHLLTRKSETLNTQTANIHRIQLTVTPSHTNC